MNLPSPSTPPHTHLMHELVRIGTRRPHYHGAPDLLKEEFQVAYLEILRMRAGVYRSYRAREPPCPPDSALAQLHQPSRRSWSVWQLTDTIDLYSRENTNMTLYELPDKPNGQELPVAVPLTGGEAEERDIPVAETGPSPDQPRKYFDPERDKELEASLREHGQLNAIIVYLSTIPPRYCIIAGERRWRAFQRLGKQTIRARVLKEPPDDIKLRELMLLDNEQRQDLTDIERGMAYLDYMTRSGCTASALAPKVGKHVSTVTRAVALIRKLPEDLREAIGPKFPPSVAQLLTPLPSDDAKRHWAKLYRDGTIKTGDELAAAIRAARNGQAAGGTAGFAWEIGGVRIAVTWTEAAAGGGSAQGLAAAEQALKAVLKDLREQGHRGLERFKDYLSKKARATKKAGELADAREALARHGSKEGGA